MANSDRTNAAANAETQAQSTSAEKDFKKRNAVETDSEGKYPEAKADDEPIFFDTTIAKLVERENADGDKEWVEVMSDNLYPGEKLKRADDDEKAAEKAKKSQDDATDAAESRKASK